MMPVCPLMPSGSGAFVVDFNSILIRSNLIEQVLTRSNRVKSKTGVSNEIHKDKEI